MTRCIRPMQFQTRTAFPVSAACVVANGVRETLAALFQSSVDVRLFEPCVPSVQAWRAITGSARLYHIRGSSADAALVIRPDASLALASAAFGEPATAARPLSAIESAVIERLVQAIAGNFTTICGPSVEALVAKPVTTIDGFLTYFELAIERPVRAAIGVALRRNRPIETCGNLCIEDMLDVQVEVRVRSEGAVVPAGELAALEPGAIVPITVSTGLTAVATIAGRPLARGECGVRGNRFAMAVGLSPCTDGGSEP